MIQIDCGFTTVLSSFPLSLSTTTILKDLLLSGASGPVKIWLFEEIRVAKGNKRMAEKEIAEVCEAICQLEELRQELRRLRRLLWESEKIQIEHSTRPLNSIMRSKLSYVS
jgi:hypothetical protein